MLRCLFSSFIHIYFNLNSMSDREGQLVSYVDILLHCKKEDGRSFQPLFQV